MMPVAPAHFCTTESAPEIWDRASILLSLFEAGDVDGDARVFVWAGAGEKRGREPFLCQRCVTTRSEPTPQRPWDAYDDDLVNRGKASLDIFWLRDEGFEESDNLPNPDVLAQEIVDDLEAALEQFKTIAADLKR